MYLFPADAPTVHDLTINPCHELALVNGLITEWHSMLGGVVGWRVAFLVSDANGTPIAVATWGRPVARREDQVHALELTRQAHGPFAPRNTGTWMLGQMRKWIRENMPEITRIISYQDADVHRGTIYKADNWSVVYDKINTASWLTRDGRQDAGRHHKIKWERTP